MTEQPDRLQLPGPYQRKADETKDVIFENDIPANNELKGIYDPPRFARPCSTFVLEPSGPIPNSAVKRWVADGSVGFHARVSHCQTLIRKP